MGAPEAEIEDTTTAIGIVGIIAEKKTESTTAGGQMTAAGIVITETETTDRSLLGGIIRAGAIIKWDDWPPHFLKHRHFFCNFLMSSVTSPIHTPINLLYGSTSSAGKNKIIEAVLLDSL